jgi:hypothetical protein
MLVKIPDCGQGLNRDLLPSELPHGMWNDCSNARFRNGFAEKRKGITAAFTTPTVTPYFLTTYATPAKRFTVHCGTGKVFVDDGTTPTEITRYTEGAAIATITRVGTTATLTTSTAHGRSTGHIVTVYGALPAAYNVTGAITVTSPTVFTYTMLSDPGASASPVGQYSYNVQSDYTGAADDRWTGGSFNGVLVLNNGVDAPQYWAGDTTVRLRRFPGWPSGQKCDSLVIFNEYLFALAPTISSVKYPHNFLWSESAEAGAMPDEWTAASTNDAGDSVKASETGGFIIDGKPWGDTLFIGKQDALFGVQYIGGNSVFRVFRTPSDDGVMSRGCMVNTPVGQVILTPGDVKIHNGGESKSIIEGSNRRWLFENMDSTYAGRSFLVTNPQKKEVWVCFPTIDQTSCNRVLPWNWESGKWGDFAIANLTYGTVGLIPAGVVSSIIDSDTDIIDTDTSTIDGNEYSQNESRLILAVSTPRIGLADTGSTDFGSAFTFMLKRIGMSFDDSDTMKVLSASRPQFKAAAGTVLSVYHGSAKTADAEPTWASAATYTVGTSNWANSFATSGRYLAVKITSVDYPEIALRSMDLDFTKAGRF